MAAPGIYTAREFLGQFENWSQDKSGIPAADTGWYGGAVYDQFLAARAQDIQEELMRDPSRPNKFVQQTIGCVLLEEAPVEECPCAPPSGCVWLRSAKELPTPIGDLIAVSAIGGNLERLENYTYRDWTSVKYTLQSRIQAERMRGYYCLRNNFLYIITPHADRKAAAVAGIFYDPVEVQRAYQCDGSVDLCTPFLDFPVFIDPGKLQKLLATTYQLISGLSNNAPFDATNNANPALGIEPFKEW